MAQHETETAAPARRVITQLITPADVARTADLADTAAWTDAAALVPAYAGHDDDADDVAAVARLYLAALLDKGHAASDAARMAVSTARKAWRALDAAQRGDTLSLDAATADDDGPVADAWTTATTPGPDALARWTDRDTLAAAWDALDDDAAGIVAALAAPCCDCLSESDALGYAAALGYGPAVPAPCNLGHGHVWTGTGRVNMAALAAVRYDGPVSGRVRAALAAVVADALAQWQETGRRIPAWRDQGHAYPGRLAAQVGPARSLARDTSVPDSGPASPVVLTRPDGRRWLCLADAWHALDDGGAASALAHLAVAAYRATRPATEETRAALSAPVTLLPTRRPAGVSPGIVYGPGRAVASDAYADARPTPSRKRKRDGGIGTSAVTGRTSLGQGRRGTPDDAGTRETAADALARRLADLDDAQRAAYDAAAQRAHDAALALKAWHDTATLDGGQATADAAPAPCQHAPCAGYWTCLLG